MAVTYLDYLVFQAIFCSPKSLILILGIVTASIAAEVEQRRKHVAKLEAMTARHRLEWSKCKDFSDMEPTLESHTREIAGLQLSTATVPVAGSRADVRA